MGRFASLVLVLTAACGDNSIVEVPDGTGDGLDPAGEAVEVAPRLVPTVCGVNEWTAKVADPRVDLSVASRADGAAIVSVPVNGGSATGVIVDARRRIVNDGTLAMGSFEKLGVSHTANRFVSTGISADTLSMHLLQDDLSSPELVMKVPGTAVAKPAFFNTNADLLMPVGGDDGVTLYRFADSFEPIGSLKVATSKRVESMTAAQLGFATFAAWSTASECYMMQMAGFAPGPMSYQATACPNPRLAVNESTGRGLMLFDSADGVRAMWTQDTMMGGDAKVIRDGARAPRVLHDGKNFWVSFLDERGDVIVGVMDASQHLITMSLGGPKPTEGAYELTMVDGFPWVFALEADGYTGHRLCAITE